MLRLSVFSFLHAKEHKQLENRGPIDGLNDTFISSDLAFRFTSESITKLSPIFFPIFLSRPAGIRLVAVKVSVRFSLSGVFQAKPRSLLPGGVERVNSLSLRDLLDHCTAAR